MDLNYHIIIFTLSVFFILFINYKIRKGERKIFIEIIVMAKENQEFSILTK